MWFQLLFIVLDTPAVRMHETIQDTMNGASEKMHPAVQQFYQLKAEGADIPLPLLAASALLRFSRETDVSTNAEFSSATEDACAAIRSLQPNRVSMIAGVLLFKSILKTPIEGNYDFATWKHSILSLVDTRINHYSCARVDCARRNVHFIRDDRTVLIHSYSKSVMELLRSAVLANKRVRAFVTEARPSMGAGLKCIAELTQLGIPAELIPDTAVGHIMERVDMVLVGAEAVVQSGGLINQIGTYQIAVMAKAAKKPFYAMAERYKFIPLYPLNQRGLPTPGVDFFDESSASAVAARLAKETHSSPTPVETAAAVSAQAVATGKISHSNSVSSGISNGVEQPSIDQLAWDIYSPSPVPYQHLQAVIKPKSPSIDYTPPEFITLILTDLGPLTPNGVSEQLALHFR